MSGKSTYNPYHFVPVKPEGHSVVDLETYLQGDHHITHDRYVDKTYSGRIVCRLTTKSPIFVGGQRIREGTDHAPALAEHFFLPDSEHLNNSEHKPAIPASSLRGLISSIGEAASNSSLRVLSDELYSYRKSMTSDEALSAIGMITVKFVDNRPVYCLTPLTLPTIRAVGKQSISSDEINKYSLKDLYPFPNLKVYIGQYQEIRQESFYRTYRHDHQKFYGLKLINRSWNSGDGIDFDNYQYRIADLLLGQRSVSDSRLRPWDEIPANEKEHYTRGILRVLGCWNERQEAIPTQKKRELFIPFPEINWSCLKIADETIERFYQLCDQRTNSKAKLLLPFEPKDTQRNLSTKDNRFRLKTGDLVYFKNVGKEITEISLSSIWRGRVEMIKNNRISSATTYDFFRAVSSSPGKLNQELLPFHAERESITLAEQVFGFVQQEKKNKDPHQDVPTDSQDKRFLALAGRLWFSHARIAAYPGKSPYLDEHNLKILDSPKPPCPSFYFKDKTGPRFIPKKKLRPDQHQPQGRKFYLHHQDSIGNNRISNNPWVSQNDKSFKQKVRVQPVCAGSIFYFHIDFDNLSKTDLGMLLFALEPTPNFRHKIGMGKSIGLGTVKIEMVGYYEIDRQARYTSMGIIDGNRYGKYFEKDKNNWPEDYQSLTGTHLVNSLDNIRNEFVKSEQTQNKIDDDIFNALSLIGDHDYHRVQTPGINQQNANNEEETFKWFVMNDRGKDGNDDKKTVVQQFLEPLGKNSKQIEPLKKHPYYTKQNGNRNR
jgi:CRISPR-associated protein (TIGR03986 family)